MAKISMTVYSAALGMQTNVEVIIPQKSSKGEIGVERGNTIGNKLKCLYILHGLSDNCTSWSRRTSIERYADKYGICVVMPFAERSFYSDIPYGPKFYTYIAKELPNIIESMFNVSDSREDRYIGGNSMGGYGALKIALSEEGRYNAAFGLSSVANIYNSNFTNVLKPVFNGIIPNEADLAFLAKQKEIIEKKPRIYTTVGKDDFMYEDNIKFKKLMESLDYDYTFVETEGEHDWSVWDVTVQNALKWMLHES